LDESRQEHIRRIAAQLELRNSRTVGQGRRVDKESGGEKRRTDGVDVVRVSSAMSGIHLLWRGVPGRPNTWDRLSGGRPCEFEIDELKSIHRYN
jgi:hypothetical protein